MGGQIDEVWLWNDYPKRWGADLRIDLIFTHRNGKLGQFNQNVSHQIMILRSLK